MIEPMTDAGRRLLAWWNARSEADPDPTWRTQRIIAIESEASVEGFRQGLEHAKTTYVPDARLMQQRRDWRTWRLHILGSPPDHVCTEACASVLRPQE